MICVDQPYVEKAFRTFLRFSGNTLLNAGNSVNDVLTIAVRRVKEKKLDGNTYNNSLVAEWMMDLLKREFPQYINKDMVNIYDLLTEVPKQETPALDSSIGKIKELLDSISRLEYKNFIDRYYGYSEAKDRMLKSFEIEFLKAMLIDVDSERVTHSDSDLNEYLIDYQKKLYETIITYLLDNNININYSSTLFNEIGTDELYRIETYLDELCNISPAELSRLSTSLDPNDLKKLNVINSYFILKNFDKLLKRQVGNLIDITNGLEGSLIDDPDLPKYSINRELDSLNATDWFNEEKKSPSELLSKRSKLVLTTMKLYLDGKFKGLYLNTDRALYLIKTLKSRGRTKRGDDIRVVNEVGKPILTKNGNPIVLSQSLYNFISTNNIKTFRDIMFTLANNPTIGYKLLFEVLSSDQFKESKIYTKLPNEGRYILDSLYKLMFADEKSLFSLDFENIYLNLIHFFNYSTSLTVRQQRVNANGDFETREMTPMSIEATVFDIKDVVNSMFPVGKLDWFLDKYNVLEHINEKDPKNSTVEFFINYVSDKNYDFKVVFTPASQNYKVYDSKGELIKVFEEYADPKLRTAGKQLFTKMGDFINDVLGKNYNTNDAFKTELLGLYSNRSNPYDASLKMLLNIVIPSFGNAVVLKKNSSEINDRKVQFGIYITDYSEIQRSPLYQGYNVIPRKCYDDLQELGNILATLEGQLTRSVIRTAENTNMSSNALYNLTAERQNQFKSLNTKEDSATKSLVQDAIASWALTREMKMGAKSKQKVKFNFNESMYSAFVLDFLNVKEDNDIVRFTEAVNSDKPTSGSVEVNWNKNSGLRLLLRGRESNDKNEKKKSLAETIPNGISLLEQKFVDTIGPVYITAYKNILSDFRDLQNYINNVLGYKVTIDPDRNFMQFNADCSAAGLDAALTLRDFITHYNLNHRSKPLTFSENVHFRRNGKAIEMNRAFMSMLIRLDKDNTLPELSTFRNLYQSDNKSGDLLYIGDYFMKNYLRMIDNCLDNNFTISLVDNEGKPLQDRWAVKLRDVSTDEDPWVAADGRIILAKVQLEDGSWKPIVDKFDLIEIKDGDYDISNPNYNFEGLYKYSTKEKGHDIKINPLMRAWAIADYYYTQMSILETNGSHVWSDAKKLTNTELEEEGALNDFNKRNVENTATAKLFNLNGLNEISEYANIAVIEDTKVPVQAIHGESSTIKPFDGCTWVDAFLVYWENGSLANEISGITKKPIIHFYNERTASGGLIKTASFGLSNEKMRNSMFFRKMMWKMSHHTWNFNDIDISNDVDITHDYKGNKIDYSDLYYYENGKYYKIIDIIKSNPSSNIYTIKRLEVDKDGNSTGKETIVNHKINSNYSFWKALGGYNSYHLSKSGTLIESENSIKKVASVGNRVGYTERKFADLAERLKWANTVLSQYDIYLFMKHSDIHYVVTAGAIKKGAANVNSTDYYTNNYDYNFFKIRMTNAGIQLDPTHQADEAQVALMTLVIAALADRGFTTDAAQDVYSALGILAQQAIAEDIEAYKELLQTGSKTKLQEVVSKQIVDAFTNLKSTDSNIAQSIASNLFELLLTKKKLEAGDIQDQIPWSDSSVFRYLVSTVSSTLNKTAIKLKSFGSLSVLNPSGGGVIELYGDKQLSAFAKNPKQLVDYANKVEKQPLGKHEVKIGRWYICTNTETNQYQMKRINNLTDYYNFVDGIDLGKYTDVHLKIVLELRDKKIVNPDGLTPELLSDVKFGLYHLSYRDGTSDYVWVDEAITRNDVAVATRVELLGRSLDSYNIFINNKEYSIYDLASIRNKKQLLDDKKRISELTKRAKRIKEATVIWGHPGTGKTWMYNQGRKDIVDFDSQYKSKLGNLEERARLKEEIGAEEYNKQLDKLFDLAKKYAIRYNKKLLVSDLHFLRDRSEDLDIITNITDLEFLIRSHERGEHDEADKLEWKSGINKAMSNVSPDKIINTTGYISDFLDNTELVSLAADTLESRLQLVQKTILEDLIKIKNKETVVVRTFEGDKEIKVNDFDVEAYEILMPMIYQTKFGLKLSDDLTEIKNNKYFFLLRFIDDLTLTANDNNYELELKRIGNKNIYITTKSLADNKNCRKVNFEKVRDTKGNIYRLNSRREKMYKLASENDQIYMDFSNRGLGEIIVTDHPEFYIDNIKYFTILKSKSSDSDKIKLILEKSNKTKKLDISQLEVDFDLFIKEYRKNKDIKELVKLAKENSPISHLINAATDMHTSFLQSLKVLAARIPSQSMLSFMSMKVAGFVSTGVNDCYVSDMQIWLQGSDFDVDKVTLMGNTFTDAGRYITWSRFMRLTDERSFEITKKLKFPTKKDVILTGVDYDLSKYEKLFNDKGKYEVKRSDKEYYEKLELMVEMINKFLEKLLGKPSALRDRILKVINDHNHTEFIDETGALMNLIQSRAVDISSDPRNALASQAPIDNATEPLKEISNDSPFGLKGKLNRAGDPTSKILALIDNQVGKMDIAITASVGIKTFFALTLYWNLKLIKPDESIKKLRFNVTLSDGSTYSTVCNVRANDLKEVAKYDPELAKRIEDGYSVDADQVISGIMSLATDNAKELSLSKLNAGLDILGMYLYGVAIGIPFKKLAKIFTSGTAAVLNEYCAGNIFLDNDLLRLKQAIGYLENGPTALKHEKYTKFNKDAIWDVVNKYNKQGDTKTLNKFIKDLTLELDAVNREIINKIKGDDENLQSLKRALIAARKYLTDVFRIKNLETLLDIKLLLAGQEELATIRDLIKNQGVKVLLEDKLRFYDRFETIILSRISNLDKETLTYVKNKMMLLNGSEDTRISFVKYFSDAVYKLAIIDLYEEIKQSFNVFEVIHNIPHYDSYLQAVFADYARLSNSAKFKAMMKLTPIIKEAYHPNSLQMIKYYKKLDNFLGRILIDSYLRENFSQITIPKKSYGIVNGLTKILDTTQNILLGTSEGNTVFKLWVEHKLLPELKKKNVGNKFILDLTSKLYNLTDSKNNISALALPIDMLSRSETELTKLERYKADFGKLAEKSYKFGGNNPILMPLTDIFFLYNLITYNNQTNKKALTPITDILYKMQGNLSDSYRMYIAKFDRLNDFVIGRHFTKEEMLQAIAPKSTEVYSNSFTGPYLYFYDYDALKFMLYLRNPDKTKQKLSPEEAELLDEFGLDEVQEEVDENMMDELEEEAGASKRRANSFRSKYTVINPLEAPTVSEFGRIDLNSNSSIIRSSRALEVKLSDIFSTTIVDNKLTKITYKTESRDEVLDTNVELDWQHRYINGELREVLNELDLIIKLQKEVKDKFNLCK